MCFCNKIDLRTFETALLEGIQMDGLQWRGRGRRFQRRIAADAGRVRLLAAPDPGLSPPAGRRTIPGGGTLPFQSSYRRLSGKDTI
jgi:hypothetical protein